MQAFKQLFVYNPRFQTWRTTFCDLKQWQVTALSDIWLQGIGRCCSAGITLKVKLAFAFRAYSNYLCYTCTTWKESACCACNTSLTFVHFSSVQVDVEHVGFRMHSTVEKHWRGTEVQRCKDKTYMGVPSHLGHVYLNQTSKTKKPQQTPTKVILNKRYFQPCLHQDFMLCKEIPMWSPHVCLCMNAYKTRVRPKTGSPPLAHMDTFALGALGFLG